MIDYERQASLLPIFAHVVAPFLPNYRRRVFFSTVYVAFLFPTFHAACVCSTGSFQTNSAFQFTSVGKRGLILFTLVGSGQQSPTTPLPVYAGRCYVRRHEYVTYYIVIIHLFVLLPTEYSVLGYSHYLRFNTSLKLILPFQVRMNLK